MTSVPSSIVPPPADLDPAVAARLTAAGQTALLAAWPGLPAAGRATLAADLADVDWTLLAEMRRLVGGRAAGAVADAAPDMTGAVTPPCLVLGDAGNAIAPDAAARRGAAALGDGLVGAVLVAGGQGSRLGHDGPKGCFPIGPVSGASLFRLLLGKLAAVRRRHGRPVPLAIMTSAATEAATREYLARESCCGLDPDDVRIFRQASLPALDAATGEMLRDEPGRLALAPDGHGGMLTALAAAGLLDWFARRGVEQVVSFQVDNPLALPLHPEFLGYHLLTAAEFSTQVVLKREPGERVGAVIESGGVHRVVEYSDLAPDLAAARLPDGRLRFHAGSIAVHAFARSFLDRAAATTDSLPLHLAFKAVPFVDAAGVRQVPAGPNAIKFERFIFDLMPLARRVCVVQIEAADGFAPLKNAPGAAADTADHVRAALVAHARRLLAFRGITVADDVPVELDPALVLDARDIHLPPGTRIDRPTVVGG
jgi:UDP-N-acetylglucosamine/UDP-N-acetylgalactosamine diphosphorylase